MAQALHDFVVRMGDSSSMKLISPAFEGNAEIPVMYTGDGADVSPPLQWSGAPKKTLEFALICEDPDAPGPRPFVHWLLCRIPASITSLPEEAIPPKHSLGKPLGADQGRNSFGRIGYGGPLPPVGHGPHRYVFELYALDAELDIKSDLTKEALLNAMEGHILEATRLIGRYQRRRKIQSA